MKTIDPKMGWDAARGEVLFTDVMLEAAAVHPKQQRAVHAIVERWTAVGAVRLAAADGVVRANAGVTWADRVLDRAVNGFANELLRDAEGRRDDKTFRAYFPEAPNEVIRLGLESELERCAHFDVVRKKVPLSKGAAAKLAAVDKAIEAGRAALAARQSAFGARMAAGLDVTRWKEDANAVRRNVHVQLQAYALENNEEHGYADRFFPVPPRGGRGAGGDGGSEDAGDGGGDGAGIKVPVEATSDGNKKPKG